MSKPTEITLNSYSETVTEYINSHIFSFDCCTFEIKKICIYRLCVKLSSHKYRSEYRKQHRYIKLQQM